MAQERNWRIATLKNQRSKMKDAKGNVIDVTEENAAEIARKEMALEKEGKDPEKEVVEDLSVIEPTVELSEEEKAEKEKADKEAAEAKAKEEDKNKEKTDEELVAANPEDLNDDEKAKREEIIKADEAETQRLVEAKEEDLNDEDKEKRKTALLKVETKNKEAFEAKVTKYAEDKKISVDDARKTLESAGKIKEKYKSDVDEIAIANLGLQHLVAKKDEEIRAVKEEASQPRRPQSAREWEVAIKERGLVSPEGKQANWEQVVADYRKANESETEGLEDEQVLRIISKEIHLRSDAHFKELKAKAKSEADDKRTKLLKAIPETDKQFSDEVKELLKTVPDAVILNPNYDIDHSVRWARGGHFTPDKIAELEKAAEERGFKRGQATKKIVSGPIGKGGPPKGDGAVTWTTKEKNEAFDMFPNVADEKEVFKLWKDVSDSRKKTKDKKK
jgi:hypothetical protein